MSCRRLLPAALRGVAVALLVLAEAACGSARNIPADPAPQRREVSHLAYYSYLMATRELREGRLPEAERLLKEAIAKDPASAFLHAELAEVVSRLGRTEEALSLARKAVALDPTMVEAHLLLADLASALRKKDEAMAVYRKVIELDPKREDA